METCVFDWKIDKPLDFPIGRATKSDPFSVGVDNVSTWQMTFYPSGSMQYTKEYAAVYLKMISGSSVKSTSTITLIIKDQIITESVLQDLVTKESNEYQLDKFARINDISYPLLIRCELRISEERGVLPYNKGVSECTQALTDIHYPPSQRKDTDLLIITRDQMKFGAHKTVLAAQSEVFSAMFESHITEDLNGKLVFIDMDGSDVEEMLEYLYSGKLTKWSLPLCMNLFAAGDKYHINAMKDMCSLYIQQNINLDASVNILVLADMHEDKILKEVALKFISGNAKSVLKSPAWETMFNKQQYLVDELILYMADKLQLD